MIKINDYNLILNKLKQSILLSTKRLLEQRLRNSFLNLQNTYDVVSTIRNQTDAPNVVEVADFRKTYQM